MLLYGTEISRNLYSTLRFFDVVGKKKVIFQRRTERLREEIGGVAERIGWVRCAS
jgi:hypothetical protein